MRALFLLVVSGLISTSVAQELPDCATLLTASEIQTTCGVPDAIVEATARTGACSISAQREGTVSMLSVVVTVLDSVEEAQATVAMAGVMGEATDGQSMPGVGNEAIGQVAELLGLQDPNAPEADAVSEAEAAFRELPDLGDGGVRSVSDFGGALGTLTHTVVFSSGATLVKLESGIVANRAGVCTADGLEVLARRVAARL